MGDFNKNPNLSSNERGCLNLKVVQFDSYGKEPKEKDIKGGMLSFHKMHYYDKRFDLKGTQYRSKDVTEAVENPLFNQPKTTRNDEFHDGRRRIDLVLVAPDDGDKRLDEIRKRFLQNVLRLGMDLEIVHGIMKIHKNLLFIKINAPDAVLDELNCVFCTKKYFRNEHLRFVKPDQTLVGKILPFTRIDHERELITLVRKQYKGKWRLSNSERSLIVYTILLQLPFGDHINYFGLNRLLERNIFLDAYALHDGQYFFEDTDDLVDGSTFNARQMLFYTWVGLKNTFKVHPLNLIREYFGEKIGMYFAFYEFYNHSLLIAVGFGLLIFILALFNETDKAFESDICMNKNSSHVCPRCNSFDSCRFIKMTNLCYLANLHKVLDSPLTVVYAMFLAVWATAFYALWKRKQNYWIWLWELNADRTKDIYRTKFSRNHLAKPKSKLTGLEMSYDVGFTRYVRLIGVLVICLCMISGFVALLAPLFMYKRFVDRTLMKRKLIPLNWEEILLVTIFAVQVVCVVQILLGFIIRQCLGFLTNLENHRTYESYDRSYSFKLFMVSFTLTFPLMFYYAWLKGVTYYLPFRVFDIKQKDEWNTYRGYFSFTHCGPFTCLDEVLIVLAATIFIRYNALPFIIYLKELLINARTDFNQGKKINMNIPCWEREYRLERITEKKMARKYNFLVMQLALVTLVGAVLPLAPLLAFISNVIRVRYEARMLLLCHRRPLLLETAGTGVWMTIIKVLAFLSIPANALTIVRTTKTIARKLYTMKKGSMHGYLFYAMEYMHTNTYENYYLSPKIGVYVREYRKTNFVPQYCYFPGLFSEPFYGDIFPIYFPNRNITFNAEHFWFRAGSYIGFIIFLVLAFFFASVICCAISSHAKELQALSRKEFKMVNDFVKISKKFDN